MSSSRKSKSGVADLVRPEHRLEHEDAVAHPQRGERLALAQRDLDDRDPVGALQRVAQQHVRLGARSRPARGSSALAKKIGSTCSAGTNSSTSIARERGQRQVGEVLVGEDDDLAAGELVALGDVVVGDLLAVDRADPLVLDPAAVARGAPGGSGCPSPRWPSRASPAMRHQPEGDRALPDRAHRRPPLARRRATPISMPITATPVRGVGAATTRERGAGWAVQPMLATAGHAAGRAGLGVRVQVGRRARARRRRAGGPTAALRRAPATRSPPPTRSWPALAEAARRRRARRRDRRAGRTGGPSFTALAERMHVRDAAEARRLAADAAGHLHGLRPAAARRRRPDRPAVRASGGPLLERLALGRPALAGPAVVRRRPGDLAGGHASNGLEGVVAKRLDVGLPARAAHRRTGSRSSSSGPASSWSAAGGTARAAGRRLGSLLVGVPGRRPA